MYKKTLCLVGLLKAVAGCRGVDRIDQAVDCNNICSRYRDCFSQSYDVNACKDRCEMMIDSNPRGADLCVTCLDNRSCLESVFPCSSECAPIING